MLLRRFVVPVLLLTVFFHRGSGRCDPQIHSCYTSQDPPVEGEPQRTQGSGSR